MMLMLTSGESYSLSQFFSGSYSIVIPDMQREYCWPSVISRTNNKNLVENFVKDLLSTDKNEAIQLGLLYAYESPKNDMQLCDGQQRVTTLYLFLGYMYSLVKNDKVSQEIKDFLISNNSFKPNRLKYAIRETTLHFLSDLVAMFLSPKKITDNVKTSGYIKNQEWYFNEYNLDPSIKNILQALDVFDKFKMELDASFASFLLHKIEFLFFDMVNRTYGEEQFVVLNTTGEPLTKTENLKPQFLGDLDDGEKVDHNHTKTKLRYYADLWEDWETFFWHNKHSEHKTADKGFNEFLRWIYILEKVSTNDKIDSEKDKYNKAQIALADNNFDIFDLEDDKIQILNTIQKYFTALKILCLDDDIKKRFLFNQQPLAQILVFEFLPLLYFIKEFDEKIESINYSRLKQFFKSRAKDDNISKASITTSIRAVQIVKKMKQADEKDIANYASYKEVASETILNKLEIFKFDILRELENRKDAEDAFWQAENYNTTQGNIAFLFFSQQRKNRIEDLSIELFDLDEFKKVKNIVESSFEKNSDLMRRSLLTFGHYYQWNGHTTSLQSHRYTLGNHPEFYGAIANNYENEHQGILLEFLDKAKNIQNISMVTLNDWMQSTIDNFTSIDSGIYEKTRYLLISEKNMISEMGKKLFCVSYDKEKSYILFQQKVTRDNSYREL
ncbi:hypothetical protein FHR24_001584 [Wenyingzhuangia heitensis]|uniref:GmrSD restriction endonucleases N-terminal domain-containing protein n=1 Tax=Wenyingzhuangia heitensis TaxID=1487859 RepID=A0ABX0UBE0_9FLAO|nr:DUF262 domain-containing protein [Wenyingzhuangia heitensis]NIJ45145.1 hypothetical protein [Wenyingzhuangia heitensis]